MLIVVLIAKPIKTGKLHPFSFNCKYGLKGHLMKAFAAEILHLLKTLEVKKKDIVDIKRRPKHLLRRQNQHLFK